jgi:hypothetical protein
LKIKSFLTFQIFQVAQAAISKKQGPVKAALVAVKLRANSLEKSQWISKNSQQRCANSH